MSGQTARYVGAGIAGLAGLALVIAAVVLLTRSDDAAPVSIVAPAPVAVSTPASSIKVQVSGEVMFPGVYAMAQDDRVIDAITAAGGIGPNADLSNLNLSQRVQDEGRYHVPAFGESMPATTASATASAASKGNGLIDLNTAQSSELETLPGIGPVMAGRIIAYREANGRFASVDDLENVPGIGPKTLDAIRQLVTVSGEQ